MTKRQRIAFEHLCLKEEDCAIDRYRWFRPPRPAILTLNIGLEEPVLFEGPPLWHCSIARILPNGGPVPLRIWEESGLRICERFIRERLLAGGGEPAREQTEIGICALHVRHGCSAREIEELNRKGFWPRPEDRARGN